MHTSTHPPIIPIIQATRKAEVLPAAGARQLCRSNMGRRESTFKQLREEDIPRCTCQGNRETPHVGTVSRRGSLRSALGDVADAPIEAGAQEGHRACGRCRKEPKACTTTSSIAVERMARSTFVLWSVSTTPCRRQRASRRCAGGRRWRLLVGAEAVAQVNPPHEQLGLFACIPDGRQLNESSTRRANAAIGNGRASSSCATLFCRSRGRARRRPLRRGRLFVCSLAFFLFALWRSGTYNSKSDPFVVKGAYEYGRCRARSANLTDAARVGKRMPNCVPPAGKSGTAVSQRSEAS